MSLAESWRRALARVLHASAESSHSRQENRSEDSLPEKAQDFIEALFRGDGSATTYQLQGQLGLMHSMVEHYGDILEGAGMLGSERI